MEYVGSLRTRLRPLSRPLACARSGTTDVTPGPVVLNDRCHCALKRLLPLGLILARGEREIHRSLARARSPVYVPRISMGVLYPPSRIAKRISSAAPSVAVNARQKRLLSRSNRHADISPHTASSRPARYCHVTIFSGNRVPIFTCQVCVKIRRFFCTCKKCFGKRARRR